MKKIFIVGVEGINSGMWDWFHTVEDANKQHEYCVRTFSHLEGEMIYRGELDVPTDLSNESITEYVEDFLITNDYNKAFVS